MSLQDADEILKDDRNEIDGLINRWKLQKNFNLLSQIAQKSDFLADLYYDAMEDFNPRYFEFKEQAALYYRKLARKAPTQEIKLNSRLLAILLLMQADKKPGAEKKLNNLRIKNKRNPSSEIDEDWFVIIELVLNNNFESARRQLRNFKADMDDNLYKFFMKTIRIAKKLDKRDSITKD